MILESKDKEASNKKTGKIYQSHLNLACQTGFGIYPFPNVVIQHL